MKIKGLTREQVERVIEKVARNHQHKAFDCYTYDDIYQQVWEIALEIMGKFDIDRKKVKNPESAFEHWLNAVISNRLRNFYRDKFTVPKKNLNITYGEAALDSRAVNLEHLLSSDVLDKIIENLSAEGVDILDSVMSGEVISNYYRQKLIDEIIEHVET